MRRCAGVLAGVLLLAVQVRAGDAFTGGLWRQFDYEVPSKEPIVSWRGHANLLYSNWLNYFVYQTTPYDVTQVARPED